MTKFHISKHGIPAPCKAEKGNCPYGGEESHFNSLEEAQEFIDKRNEERYGLLNSVDERRKMDKHDREKEVADIPGYKKTQEDIYKETTNDALIECSRTMYTLYKNLIEEGFKPNEASQTVYTLYKNLIEEGFKPNEALYLLAEII